MASRIGFIGAGQMARALARGLIAAKLVDAQDVRAADVSTEAVDAFARLTGGQARPDNRTVADESDILFLAVKPQQMDAVLGELAPSALARHLIVSIAAGYPLAKMARALGADRRFARVMPNTACLVGASASAYAMGGAATADDGELVGRLLGAVGLAAAVPEPLLDAVTGLSGSGPAYAFLMIEALSDGGVRAGLPRDVATRLAAQTLLGAAKMVLETGQHPGALKDMVTSPGGTTIAGLAILEERAVRGALIDAVKAAADRSRELAGG